MLKFSTPPTPDKPVHLLFDDHGQFLKSGTQEDIDGGLLFLHRINSVMDGFARPEDCTVVQFPELTERHLALIQTGTLTLNDLH